MNQSRNRVQYDLNDCREILNSTIFEYQLVNDNSCIVNDTTIPQITIISPLNRVYTTRNISFVLFSNEELSGCTFSLTSLSSGNTEENRMTLSGDKKRAEKNITQLINGDYHVLFNCSDIQRNVNDSEFADFSVNSSSIQPRIELTILSPLSNIEVDRNSIFNVTLKVKCLESDCGNIRVSLDPEQKVSGWGRIAGWLKNLFGFNKKKIYLSPSPKGLVSSATGALPFYTNETNPRLINLRKDESEEVAFFVNATGLSAIYEFFAYANLTDNENIMNETNHFNVSVYLPGQIDNIMPFVRSYLDNIFYTNNPEVIFVCNISDNVGISNLSLEINNETRSNIFSDTFHIFGLEASKYWIFSLPYFGVFKWNCGGCDNSSNCAKSDNYTIIYSRSGQDEFPPVFINLQNFTHTINTEFNEIVLAEDASGIDRYWLNENDVFEINRYNGNIKNKTALSTLSLYWLNISVNDTLGNIENEIFYINITFAGDTTPPKVKILSPLSSTYTVNSYSVEIFLNEPGMCNYSTDNGAVNKTLLTINNISFTSIDSGISNGEYVLRAYCFDYAKNFNNSESVSFAVSVSAIIPPTGGGGGGNKITCVDTCNSLGYNCGIQNVCGNNQNCGSCSGNKICVLGKCIINCIENWECSEWSVCTNNILTRNCRDLNGCGTNLTRPYEQENCSENEKPNKTKISWKWIFIIFGGAIIAGLLIWWFLFILRRIRESKKVIYSVKPTRKPLEDIERLLKDGRYYVNQKEILAARNVYEEIRQLFDMLTEEEQKSIGGKILEFYNNLK
jgi:hypothetical protein